LIKDGYPLCDDRDIGYEKPNKFGKHLAEMVTYIDNGAHYLLQTRAAVFNDELRDNFERRFPALKAATNDGEATLSQWGIA
jgi:hypothetical protein